MASKDLERAILSICAERVVGFPTGVATDHESPDFLVSEGHRTIGIEMQEFIQGAGPDGAPLREAESLRSQTMRLAQREFESRNPDTHLYVYGHWNRAAEMDGGMPRMLAGKLSTLVEGLIPPPPLAPEPMSKRDARYHELEASRLDRHFTHIDIWRYARATYGLWAPPEWGFASRDLADLRNQIRAKEGKLPAYRESSDEVWLIMHGLALPSGLFDMELLVGQQVESPFDHVVFLDAVSREYVRLAG